MAILINGELLEGDLIDLGEAFAPDAGLETEVIISLFTDRRARDDDILPDPNSTDKRGWWGDLVSKIQNDEIGARQWLLERSKTEQQVLILTKSFVKEALQWMIDDGVAIKIDVEVERLGAVPNSILAYAAKIHKSDGTIIALNFDDKWNNQLNLN